LTLLSPIPLAVPPFQSCPEHIFHPSHPCTIHLLDPCAEPPSPLLSTSDRPGSVEGKRAKETGHSHRCQVLVGRACHSSPAPLNNRGKGDFRRQSGPRPHLLQRKSPSAASTGNQDS
jgi:hypothetical protein